jgi:hypothetical protein
MLFQRRNRLGVVAVSVGDQDMGDTFPLKRHCKSLQMRLVMRPGIDHCHIAAADDVGVRALECEGARVVGNHTAHARSDLDGHAIVKIHL